MRIVQAIKPKKTLRVELLYLDVSGKKQIKRKSFEKKGHSHTHTHTQPPFPLPYQEKSKSIRRTRGGIAFRAISDRLRNIGMYNINTKQHRFGRHH